VVPKEKKRAMRLLLAQIEAMKNNGLAADAMATDFVSHRIQPLGSPNPERLSEQDTEVEGSVQGSLPSPQPNPIFL